MSPRLFPLPVDEPQRLEALRGYRLNGPVPEAEFDHVVRLAVDLFDVPSALVSFVEDERQFFKARIGFEACETSRYVSFCAHALMSDDVLVIPDARADERIAANPLVTGHPFIRDLDTDPDDAAFVKAILAMGASLGLEVIAEGIETAEQAVILADFDCREAQGYRFVKPVPAAAFTSLLTPASDCAAA